MRNLFIAIVFVATSTTFVSAQSMPDPALRFLDADQNGEVAIDEYVARMKMLFHAMDTNLNNSVEFGEVETFMTREVFDTADVNSDARISEKEFEGMVRKDFETSDRNSDGSLN